MVWVTWQYVWSFEAQMLRCQAGVGDKIHYCTYKTRFYGLVVMLYVFIIKQWLWVRFQVRAFFLIIITITTTRNGQEWPRTFLVYSCGIFLPLLLKSRNIRNGPGMDQKWTRNDIEEIHQIFFIS